MAAAAKLAPPSTGLPTSSPAKSSCDGSVGPNTAAAAVLCRRAIRLASQFSSREVGMVASGAAALQWHDLPLAEALVQSLWKQTTVLRPNGGAALRLADINALMEFAIASQLYSSCTLQVVVREYAAATAATRVVQPTRATVELFLLLASLSIGETAAAAVALTLMDSATPGSPLQEMLQRFTAPGSFQPSAPLRSRYDFLREGKAAFLASLHTTPSEGEVDAAVLYHRQQCEARRDVLHYIQRYGATAEEMTAAGGSSSSDGPSVESLLQLIEKVRRYRIRDPSAVAAMDAIISKALKRLSITTTSSGLLEAAVYQNSLSFPLSLQICEMASAGSSTSTSSYDALELTKGVVKCYAAAVRGIQVTERDLYRMSGELHGYSADEVAQAVFAFARFKEVPPTLVASLAAVATSLSLVGTTALVRAARYDRTGVVQPILETHLSSTTLMASLQTSLPHLLIELSSALAIPHPRWLMVGEALRKAEQDICCELYGRFEMELDTLPPHSAWALLKALPRGMASKEVASLLQAVCSRLAGVFSASSTWDAAAALGALEILKECDVTHERLLDVLADCLVAAFEAPQPGAWTDPQKNDALRFALLQVDYDAPDLYTAGHRLIKAANQRAKAEVPVELLMAGALLSLHSPSSSFSCDVLRHLVEEQRLSDDCTAAQLEGAISLAFYLRESAAATASTLAHHLLHLCTPHVEKLSGESLAMLLVTAATPAQPRQLSKETGSGQQAAALIVPGTFYARLAEHLQTLAPPLFTQLCEVVRCTAVDTGFANALIEAVPRVADGLNAGQLSQSLFCLGEVSDAGQRLTHQVMTEVMADYVVDNAELFWSGRDIARMLHGFAKLLCVKRSLYSVFSERLALRPIIATLDHNSISLLYYAFGSVRFLNQKLMGRLTNIYTRHAAELLPADLLLSLRGHSRMHLLDEPFYTALGTAAVRQADCFSLQSQCELLQAFGAVEMPNDPLAECLIPRIAARVEELPQPSQAVDVVVSLWMMSYDVQSSPEVAKLMAYIVDNMNQLQGPDIMKLCSVLHDQRWSHRPLLTAIADRSVALKQLDSLDNATARVVMDELGRSMIHHSTARRELSQLARAVSKEVVMLSEEEEEQLRLVLSQ